MRNLYIFLLLLVGVGVFGQKTKPVVKPPCATDEVYQELVKNDPSLSKRMDEMNEQIRNFANEYKKSASNRTAQTNFTIPVIVYVVHNNQPLGAGSNISDAQVQNQLVALNNYYSGSGLNFCLATRAGGTQNLLQAAGNLPTASSITPGIIHVNNATTATHQTTTSSQQALVGGTSGYGTINKDRYLRIWVVESINGDTTSGIQGYSYFPNTSTILDGIVMNYRVFGNNNTTPVSNWSLTPNYQQGKILAHEVGHYLGLRHTFDGGCHDTTGFNSQILGDLVVDTPPVKAANFGCPSNVDSCPGSGLDDISNYMDYTYDACKNHFTTGQNERMLFQLMNYRSNLYDTDNLIFTGVCGSSNLVSSSFTGSLENTGNSYIYNICAGSTMYFKPTTQSTSYPAGTVSYLWDFGNGVTSTLENPSTVYNLSSNTFYTVTLTVTSNGNSSTSSKNIYVNNCSSIVNKESTWYYNAKNILKFDSGIPRNVGTVDFPGVGYSTTADNRDKAFDRLSMLNSDNGDVIFFTDNKDIFNGSNPAVKINSTMLIGSDWNSNSSIILKSPINNNQYYVIHKLGQDQSLIFPDSYAGIRYSVVNVNNGIPSMSNVINIPIVPNPSQTGFKISTFDGAFRGAAAVEVIEKVNGGYWIITQLVKNDNKTYLGVFDFSSSGTINLKNTFELPNTFWPQSSGVLYINQCTDYISISKNADKILYSYNGSRLLILDFDKFEGLISRTTSTTELNNYNIVFTDHAFSPNSKLIYTRYGQIDIDTPSAIINPVANSIFGHSYIQGPDSKIYYLSSIRGKSQLGVIHKPNMKVTDQEPNIFLDQFDILSHQFDFSFNNTPYFPNFIDAKKETAYDVNQISTYKAGCNAYKFFPDVNINTATPSFIWNFGDPNSGSNNTSTLNTPIHEFSASGTYTVSLTYNGTTSITTQVTITTFAPPAIQGTSEVCFSNGTATTFNSVALQNGQTVVWSILSGTGTILQNNQTEVQINWTQLGTISALITDPTGCSGTVTKTITVLPNITPTFSSITTSFCSGSTAPVLPGVSNNGITGSWSPSTVSNTNSGSYVFTANSNYCATPVTISITVLQSNDPSCNSNPCPASLTLSTTENNSTIIYKTANWIEANSNYVVDVNKNVTMKAGDFIVFKPDAHLKAGAEVTAKIETCTPTSRIAITKEFEKVEEEVVNQLISLFPNPTTDRLTIASENTIMNSVIITAMDGKIIYNNHAVNSNTLELDTSSYQGGIYMVSITTTNGTGFVKKLIKN